MQSELRKTQKIYKRKNSKKSVQKFARNVFCLFFKHYSSNTLFITLIPRTQGFSKSYTNLPTKLNKKKMEFGRTDSQQKLISNKEKKLNQFRFVDVHI